MSIQTQSQKHVRQVLMGAFLGLTGLFFSLVATIDANEPASIKASVVQASENETQLSAEKVSEVIEQRKDLLSRELTVTLQDSVTGPITSWHLSMQDFPAWVTFRIQNGEPVVQLDEKRVKQHIISYPPEGLPLPQSCTVTRHYTDDEDVQRIETDCIAKSGYVYDIEKVTAAVMTALQENVENIDIELEKVPGQLFDPESSPERPLVLLSTGRSNFKGSGLGRKSNVRKAINEHENNVFIPADSEFRFNDTLGIVSLSRGWKEALTIFEGVNLRPAPGGGVCQASTTVFRAAINAGLPIVQQKNHSLYVTYYEAYGVGLDATIFPGKQDLRFKNDTGGPIIMQAYTEGDEAYVNFYGYDDQRTVALSGPYFWDDENVLEDGKTIRKNEIVWKRSVMKDGQETSDVVTAKYNAIPRTLHEKWAAETIQTRGGDAEKRVDVAAAE